MAEVTREFGRVRLSVLDSAEELGAAVARRAAAVLTDAVARQGSARAVFATGNSQMPFVRALGQQPDVPWDAVSVFHMDEYVGLSADHPASFRRWIAENVVEPFGPARVDYIEGDTRDPEAEARRYADALGEQPVDLVCMGIGENGHLAFNEPYQADLDDTAWARVIRLDEASRLQQVGEGHFPNIDAVPQTAISLTVPALLSAEAILVTVPEERKAEAVRAALTGPVSNACPASILRERGHAELFCDTESASLLDSGDARTG